MKKKYLRKFIALFDGLPEAAEILSGKYDNNQTEMEILSSTISAAYRTNCAIIDDPENKFLKKVLGEIDDNLYEYYACREIYIKAVLRGFMGIAPFLVFSSDMEWLYGEDDSSLIGDKNYPSLYFATLSLIVESEESSGRNEDELTDTEKYILSCSGLLHLFVDSFDANCLEFDIDLVDIQAELNIFIFQERDFEKLALYGYSDKVKQLIKKEEPAQKALPEARPPKIDTLKSFPEHLIHKKPLKLAAMCKNLFNRHESPKDYAIMLCLLVEHKYVAIPERKRSDFFRSWYTYISRKIPTNFEAENKHIDAVDGLRFYNDTDKDYMDLKRFFNKSLPGLK